MISIDHFNDDFDERLKNVTKPIMLFDGHLTYNPFLIPPLLSVCNAKCPYYMRPLKNIEQMDPFK